MSNRQLAEKLGVSHPYIGQRYAGEKDFTLDDVARAAQLFDVPVLDLLTRASHAADRTHGTSLE